jgi:hypothetical protein
MFSSCRDDLAAMVNIARTGGLADDANPEWRRHRENLAKWKINPHPDFGLLWVKGESVFMFSVERPDFPQKVLGQIFHTKADPSEVLLVVYGKKINWFALAPEWYCNP